LTRHLKEITNYKHHAMVGYEHV